ncbi:mannosyltransferase putative-domain-containing protein [Scheffersomyces amazonensis]|uniref:mannosyltransferase putative-domain-containing protein n=1 Tax=Scheffersomyces amazonensis TaxID=1078765 RepID=UPI00315C58FA
MYVRMRFTLKRLVTLGVLLVVGSGIFFLLNASSGSLTQLYQDIFIFEQFDYNSFKQSDYIIRQQLHYSNYLYSGYNEFVKKYGSTNKIAKIPLEHKCQTLFEQFDAQYPEWMFPRFENPLDQFDKSITDKLSFFSKSKSVILKQERDREIQIRYEEQKRQLEQEMANANDNDKTNDNNDKSNNKDKNNKDIKPTPNQEDKPPREFSYRENITINNQFKQKILRSKEIEQSMADTVTLLRLYNKCYLENRDTRSKNAKNEELFNKFSHKFFSYFTKNLPTFEFPAGKDLPTNEFPILNQTNGFQQQTIKFDSEKQNMIDFLHENSNGRGIVISAATRHAKDIIRLIRLLRAMNNRLPIQIIYKGDINRKSKELIVQVAHADIETLLDKSSTKEHELYMPELDLLESYKQYGSEFPKQEIWFVNLSNTFEKGFKYAFPGYSNKILALLFSSFKEIIMFDADTIPLVPLTEFFDSPKYQSSGTYFFRDRSLRDTNDYIETNYFSKLFHTNEKSIDSFFDIPRITSKTMENAYMTGYRHHQEAGVVVIDKVRHFGGVLMGLPLSLWKEPVKSSIWGEKEMYWLGMAMAGDENYEFNDYGAASIGELTPEKFKYYPNSKANEICSSHPGHVDGDGRLLWLNSGFGYCKKNGYYRDRVKHPFSLMKTEELDILFRSPVKIRAAIVPPELPYFRLPGSPPDTSREKELVNKWGTRRRDTDEITLRAVKAGEFPDMTIPWEPQKGWVKSSICNGYQYCAYDSIQSYNDTSSTEDLTFDRGYTFEFSDSDIKMYDYLGKVWITSSKNALDPDISLAQKQETPPTPQQQKDTKAKIEQIRKDNNLPSPKDAEVKVKEEVEQQKVLDGGEQVDSSNTKNGDKSS